MQDIPTVLGDVIERNARYFPGKTAVVCEERRVTYSEFAARVRKFANALASGGLQPQARFAILAQNCLEYFEAVGAAERAGFIAVTLNWRLSPQELAQIVADCTPTVLIFEAQFGVQAESLRRLGGIERFIVIGAATDWAESYEEVLAAAPDTPPTTRPAPGDGVYLIYTSGTTGRPKGVLLSHRAILTAAVGISWESGVRPADRMLIVMPLFHIGGKINQLANMVIGATIFLHRAFDATAVLRCIETERITSAHFAPVMVRALLDHPDLGRFRLDTLRSIQYASAPMSVAQLREAMAAFGPIFTQVYGMTECVVGTILHAHEHRPDGTAAEVRRLASAGQPFFDHAIRVARPDGSRLHARRDRRHSHPRSEPDDGLLEQQRGNRRNVARRLDAHRRRRLLRRRGLSLRRRPQEGHGHLRRREHLLARGGGGVADPSGGAAGGGDRRAGRQWGESVKACIVLRPACSTDEAELIQHCRNLIASYKKPRSIDFLGELPRLFNGKIDKKQLRARYWKGEGRQVS